MAGLEGVAESEAARRELHSEEQRQAGLIDTGTPSEIAAIFELRTPVGGSVLCEPAKIPPET